MTLNKLTPWARYLISYKGKQYNALFVTQHFLFNGQIARLNEVIVIKLLKGSANE